MGVRAYDPVLGRFLAVDPIDGASLNAYDYSFQDPINIYDLDGRDPWARDAYDARKKKKSKSTVYRLKLDVSYPLGNSKAEAKNAFKGGGQAGDAMKSAANKFFNKASSTSTEYSATLIGKNRVLLNYYTPGKSGQGYGKVYGAIVDLEAGTMRYITANRNPAGQLSNVKHWLSSWKPPG